MNLLVFIIVSIVCFVVGFVLGEYFSHKEADRRISEMRQYTQESIGQMEKQFELLAHNVLDKQKDKLQQDSNSHMEMVLKPLKDHLDHLDQALRDTNEKSVAQHTSFQMAIRQLSEQTQTIGKEAAQLSRALRSDTKVQGDWGEMVLARILDSSGLRQGEEYEVQKNYKTEDGKDVRPDIIIHFPEGRNLIIDSKVSLKDFTEYINADTLLDKEQSMKRHIMSVKRHIDELSRKNYVKDVKGSSEYVLMFMPSEASYIYAVQADDSLNAYAWERHVIIVCPNMLMMTLQIVNNIWQSQRQVKNVEKIIEAANGLYYQFANFAEIFSKISKDIQTIQNDYDLARNRLSEGKGNLVRRFEDMRSLGLSPKKNIPESFTHNNQ